MPRKSQLVQAKLPFPSPTATTPSYDDDDDLPDRLLCPISLEIFKDPVYACSSSLCSERHMCSLTVHRTADGNIYDRSSIELYIATKKHGGINKKAITSPLTNLPFKTLRLVPATAKKVEVIAFTNKKPSQVVNHNPGERARRLVETPIPTHLVCALTKALLIDPVVARAYALGFFLF